jgi:hypothetical protein
VPWGQGHQEMIASGDTGQSGEDHGEVYSARPYCRNSAYTATHLLLPSHASQGLRVASHFKGGRWF